MEAAESNNWSCVLSQMSTEEEKYQYAELNVRMHTTEYNVDCINKEIDILDGDLDELSLRIVILWLQRVREMPQ